MKFSFGIWLSLFLFSTSQMSLAEEIQLDPNAAVKNKLQAPTSYDTALPARPNGWSEWRNVGDCSKPCNGGQQKQERTCQSSVDAAGKSSSTACAGEKEQTIPCNTGSCPNATELRSKMVQAINDNNASIVEILFYEGADINSRDAAGICGLNYALENDQLLVAMKLIHLGADLNCTNTEDRRTPLMQVCKYATTWPQHLLGPGVRINAQDSKGCTALQFLAASINSRHQEFEALFKKYDELRAANQIEIVDLNLKNRQGCTALNYAEAQGATQVVALLKKRGAKRAFGCKGITRVRFGVEITY